MFVEILLTVLCLVLLYWSLKTNNYWKKRNILQVEDISLKFVFSKYSMPEICKDIYDKYDSPHIGTSTGKRQTLMLRNAEDIQAVLAGDFHSFHSRRLQLNSSDLLGDNIVFMNDFQRWKLIRQKLTPVFTSSRIKSMFYILDQCARDFVDLVDEKPELRKKPFTLVYTYTTAAIGASVFGIDTQAKSTMDSPLVEMAWKALDPTMKANLILIIADLFPGLFKLLQLKMFGDHEKFFINMMKNVLESRKNETQKRHDFIEICLELKRQGMMKDSTTGYELEPTDELLAAQAFFFFIAGADTSATVMHFTLLELASNPKILSKLHKEIDDIFKNGAELTYNDVDKLQYLDKVLNESMRKYPPIGILQRLCTKDTVLPSGVPIEKEVVCLIPVFAIQRDEKNYPNPDVFDPERFDSDNPSGKGKYTFLPFGEGNRNCIGARFARLQIKTGFARLLRRFTLTEQEYKPVKFEKSAFGLRASDAFYEFKLRDI